MFSVISTETAFLDVSLAVLCRLVGCISRLWIVEAAWVVQLISGVVVVRVVVRVRVHGYFLCNGCRRCWLLHGFLLLFFFHRRRRRRWWVDHNLPLYGSGWVVNQAVWVPVGVAVVLHALEGADGGWGRLLDEDGRRWRWGRLHWWRVCHRGWWGDLLGGAVGVVTRVTENWHSARGQVDDVGLAEGVLGVTQVEHVSLGNGWNKRERRLGGLWHPFHWRRGGHFALLVRGWVTHAHWHSQFVLEIGGVGAVGVLQVPHLLVEHPQLVDLIELRGGKTTSRDNLSIADTGLKISRMAPYTENFKQ